MDTLLEAIIKKHFIEVQTNELPACTGEQLWNGKWWVPKWGCDTLAALVDDLKDACG